MAGNLLKGGRATALARDVALCIGAAGESTGKTIIAFHGLHFDCFQQHDAEAALCEFYRRRQTLKPGADNQDVGAVCTLQERLGRRSLKTGLVVAFPVEPGIRVEQHGQLSTNP